MIVNPTELVAWPSWMCPPCQTRWVRLSFGIAAVSVLFAGVLAGCSSHRHPKYCNASTKTRLSTLSSQLSAPPASTLANSSEPSCDDSTDSVSLEREYRPNDGIVAPAVQALTHGLTVGGWTAHPEQRTPPSADGSAVVAYFERVENNQTFSAKLLTASHSTYGVDSVLLIVGAG